MNEKFDVCAPRPKKDGGVYWHRCGNAFDGEKGITIFFDSLPLPDNEGKVIVKLFKQKPKDAPQQSKPGYASDYDDDLPAF